MENFKYLVNKCGTTRTGFNSLDEAQAYAKKVGGEVVENKSDGPSDLEKAQGIGVLRETENFIQLNDYSIYWKYNGRNLGGNKTKG